MSQVISINTMTRVTFVMTCCLVLTTWSVFANVNYVEVTEDTEMVVEIPVFVDNAGVVRWKEIEIQDRVQTTVRKVMERANKILSKMRSMTPARRLSIDVTEITILPKETFSFNRSLVRCAVPSRKPCPYTVYVNSNDALDEFSDWLSKNKAYDVAVLFTGYELAYKHGSTVYYDEARYLDRASSVCTKQAVVVFEITELLKPSVITGVIARTVSFGGEYLNEWDNSCFSSLSELIHNSLLRPYIKTQHGPLNKWMAKCLVEKNV